MPPVTLIKRRLLQISFITLIASATFFIALQQVHAYSIYPYKWGVTTVNYDPHTLGSGWITIASDGRQPWNNVSPSPFNMQRNDSSANNVVFGYVDGGGGGVAGTGWLCSGNPCSAGQTVTLANIIIENPPLSSPPVVWHTNSNCMIPSNGMDARGVLTHEFGHFATLAHSSSGCSGSNPATMCSSIPAGTGGCAYRTLTSDDQAGLNAQYP